MNLDDAIRAAAEKNGVQQEFWDIFGQPHITAPETNLAILTALGIDPDAPESVKLPPTVLVVSRSEEHTSELQSLV